MNSSSIHHRRQQIKQQRNKYFTLFIHYILHRPANRVSRDSLFIQRSNPVKERAREHSLLAHRLTHYCSVTTERIRLDQTGWAGGRGCRWNYPLLQHSMRRGAALFPSIREKPGVLARSQSVSCVSTRQPQLMLTAKIYKNLPPSPLKQRRQHVTTMWN